MKKSADRYEVTFHVNVIADYFLIKGLLPILFEQENSRNFVTGSNSHFADQEHNQRMISVPYWNEENLDSLVLPIGNDADKDPNSLSATARTYAGSKSALIYLVH